MIFQQFPKNLCNQMYSQAAKDIEIINENVEYSQRAFGYLRKSSLYLLISLLMQNIKHDLHNNCLSLILDTLRESPELKFPVQKTYITIIVNCLQTLIKNTDMPSLKLKNKIFTEIFTLLSHKFDCVNKAALL